MPGVATSLLIKQAPKRIQVLLKKITPLLNHSTMTSVAASTVTSVAASAVKKIHPLTKETIAPKTCVGLFHAGPYSEIGGTFQKFFSQLNSEKKKEESSCGGCGAGTMGGKMLGLYLDNPRTTKPEDLRSYAAMEINAKDYASKDWPEGWKKIEVGGGPAAVLTVNGSYSQLAEAWRGFGDRLGEQGWKCSAKPEHISQEMYIDMDMKDDTKNVTKLVLFLEE